MSASTVALLLALPAAWGGTWGTSVSSDVSGGQISLAPGEDPRATLSTSIVPGASFSIGDRLTSFNLRYGLRMFRRFELEDTGIPDTVGFIVMHTAGAGASLRLSKGWNVNGSVTANIGEVDVPNAQAVLTQSGGTTGTTGTTGGTGTTGTGTTNGVTAAPGTFVTSSGKISTAMINGGASLGGKLTRALSFTLGFNASYSGPLGDQAGTNLPTGFGNTAQSQYSGATSVARALTRRDTVNVAGTASYSTSELLGGYRSMSITVGYGRKLGPTTAFAASLGVLQIQPVGDDPTFTDVDGTTITQAAAWRVAAISPAFSLSLGTRLVRTRDVTARFSLQSAITSQQNFNTGAFEPRLNSSLSISATLFRDWQAGASAMLGTIATLSPIDPALRMQNAGNNANIVGDPELTETVISVAVPVSYTFNSNFSANASFSYSIYGQRFVNPDFELVSPSYTFLLSLRMGLSQRF